MKRILCNIFVLSISLSSFAVKAVARQPSVNQNLVFASADNYNTNLTAQNTGEYQGDADTMLEEAKKILDTSEQANYENSSAKTNLVKSSFLRYSASQSGSSVTFMEN
jgi:hypothetical protein